MPGTANRGYLLLLFASLNSFLLKVRSCNKLCQKVRSAKDGRGEVICDATYQYFQLHRQLIDYDHFLEVRQSVLLTTSIMKVRLG